MEKEQLQKILENHKNWLLGKDGERADLSGADLSYADLSGADLSYANLNSANLRGADLSYADLSGADLSYANLNSANLRGANLRGANLSSANLSSADLSSADLSGADLSYADLRGANLMDVRSNMDTTMYNLQCPEEGSYIAWKKCRNNVLVKLLITEDSLRSSATSRKCRASKAKVLEIIGADVAVSTYDDNFTYEVGVTIIIPDFDTDRWNECSNGIHHFITRSEAESY
jgi:uncharacterized protein YjbI with pentapeptide repeats